ncbi:putative ATP-dependent DEAD/H RNA helicase [Trypanosoma conorhini]|uniref:Putative ATP-dependent DEAD/H RNA helicase n=1 Tax=Trypanosoma conorhini TaxID=83891 RepID=A0A3R7NT06_9TRYP|nr:putative ATP-dependent DEAD/H RNA helicase [Trypanosoma conorhini]RNF26609.1 putative ATP-dependent DEAD/H RNA helicase [Trypanosoma conorhini]
MGEGIGVETVSGPKKSVKDWSQFVNRPSQALVIIDSVFYSWVMESPWALAEEISLVIFDEVHNALGGFPRKLVEMTHKVRTLNGVPGPAEGSFAAAPHPQILGLTASPVLHFTHYGTLVELLEITQCELVSVTANLHDLREKVPIPTTVAMEYNLSPAEAAFELYLRNMANEIHERNEVANHSLLKKLRKSYMATPAYLNKCEQLRAAALQGLNGRHDLFAFAVASFLLQVSKALMALEEESLEQAYNLVVHKSVFDCLRKDRYGAALLLPFLEGVIAVMRHIRERYPAYALRLGAEGAPTNSLTFSSKLLFLMQLLKWFADCVVSAKVAFRGIVFCDTRASAYRILGEIKKTHFNDIYKPSAFVGKGNALLNDEDVHMTDAAQRRVLQEFREGATRLLLATSVAEEGLDISSCNVVIRYDSCMTLRGFIQSRGRARLRNSIFIVMENMRRKWKVAKVAAKALAIQEELVSKAIMEQRKRLTVKQHFWEADPRWWLQQLAKQPWAIVWQKETKNVSSGVVGPWICEMVALIVEQRGTPREGSKKYEAVGTGSLWNARRKAEAALCDALGEAGCFSFAPEILAGPSQKLLKFLSRDLCVCQASTLSLEELRRLYAPGAKEVNVYNKFEWHPHTPSDFLLDEIRRRRLPKPEISAEHDGKPGTVCLRLSRRTLTGEIESKEIVETGDEPLEAASLKALRFLGVVFLTGVPCDMTQLLEASAMQHGGASGNAA